MKKNLLRRANVGNENVPAPGCGSRSVLIANSYSLISAGTESSSVKRNVKDMVVKAMTDPDLRQSVKDMLVKDGIGRTMDRVNYETTKWTPLGYSGAGIAVEVGAEVDGIKAGQLVAHAGQGHAEIIRAARNLCVGVPEGVSPRHAAFVALGSIALQAVRRAEIQVGDSVAVVGLGLVGQLAVQLARVAGARVIGVDVLPDRRKIAEQLGAEVCLPAGETLPADIRRLTGGVGADRVLICASTSANVVIEQAIDMSRDRGRVVLVGFVGLDVPQQRMYMKEVDLIISRSYGPGRYDASYEQDGVDYPIGYVRWTEQRNMAEFLRLIQSNRINLEPLVSHEFELAASDQAYELLMEKPSECLAVLLKYNEQAPDLVRTVPTAKAAKAGPTPKGAVRVAVVGCGGFARQFHLPNLRDGANTKIRTIVTSSAQTAKEMADRYGAEKASTSLAETLADPEVDAVFVLTRDASHASMTMQALRAGKHVFCEKPLAISAEECHAIAETTASGGPLCMVGFNRRFAPLMQRAKKICDGLVGPAICTYRVNAGPLPPDSWIFDPGSGAGRIVGEVCHFVDLVAWVIGSRPVDVTAQAMGTHTSLPRLEDVAATLRFEDGSVATIIYTAAGTTSYSKERLEIFRGGSVVVMDDFRQLTVRGKQRLDEKDRGDKGHGAELAHFAAAVQGKTPLAITHHDGIIATLCCLAMQESAARAGELIAIEAPNSRADL